METISSPNTPTVSPIPGGAARVVPRFTTPTMRISSAKDGGSADPSGTEDSADGGRNTSTHNAPTNAKHADAPRGSHRTNTNAATATNAIATANGEKTSRATTRQTPRPPTTQLSTIPQPPMT